MNEKTKELIAIGASVAAHCQPCLKYHYAKARELGIELLEINEAVDVGHQVSRGATKAICDFQATLVTQQYTATSSAIGCCGGNDGGGGAKCC